VLTLLATLRFLRDQYGRPVCFIEIHPDPPR
jgi:hypothetical protein